MQPKPVISHQGKALIENAVMLGIPINDLLTADGAEVAWTPLQDFIVTIRGVLVEFRKGEPIRQAYRINELQGLGCPVASLEPELWRRIMIAQPAKAKPDVISLKSGYMGLSIDLKALEQQGWLWIKCWLGKSS